MKFFLGAFFAFTLAGCSSVPLDPDNGAMKISADVGVNSDDIEVLNRCNFFPFSYGVQGQAYMQSCVFALTNEHFYFLGFDKSKGAYTIYYKQNIRDLDCALHESEGAGKGMMTLFTKKRAFRTALFRIKNNRLDYEAAEATISLLKEDGVPVIAGKSAVISPFVRYDSNVMSPCQTIKSGV